MHAERLRAVADRIQAEGDEHFDMSQWFIDPERGYCPNLPIMGVHQLQESTCGTTGCIGGWAATLMNEEGLNLSTDWVNFEVEVGSWLGLDRRERDALFYTWTSTSIWVRLRDDYNFERITEPGEVGYHVPADAAVDVLRKLADGEYEL